jgi:hypothetical protein
MGRSCHEAGGGPDEIARYRPASCEGCGAGLGADAELVGFTWGQVFDLAEVRLMVTAPDGDRT